VNEAKGHCDHVIIGLEKKIREFPLLPALSQRPNFVISEPSTVSVADDNGEMEGISLEPVLDGNEFARVWWNMFSFAVL
jgi:hypothetical protein